MRKSELSLRKVFDLVFTGLFWFHVAVGIAVSCTVPFRALSHEVILPFEIGTALAGPHFIDKLASIGSVMLTCSLTGVFRGIAMGLAVVVGLWLVRLTQSGREKEH